MTAKRFTIKEFSTLNAMASIDVICDEGIELPTSTACDLLNALHEENEDCKHLCKEYRRIKDRCCANSHNAHQFLNCYEKAINDLEEEYKGNNVAKEVLRKLDEYYDKYERKVVLE